MEILTCVKEESTELEAAVRVTLADGVQGMNPGCSAWRCTPAAQLLLRAPAIPKSNFGTCRRALARRLSQTMLTKYGAWHFDQTAGVWFRCLMTKVWHCTMLNEYKQQSIANEHSAACSYRYSFLKCDQCIDQITERFWRPHGALQDSADIRTAINSCVSLHITFDLQCCKQAQQLREHDEDYPWHHATLMEHPWHAGLCAPTAVKSA